MEIRKLLQTLHLLPGRSSSPMDQDGHGDLYDNTSPGPAAGHDTRPTPLVADPEPVTAGLNSSDPEPVAVEAAVDPATLSDHSQEELMGFLAGPTRRTAASDTSLNLQPTPTTSDLNAPLMVLDNPPVAAEDIPVAPQARAATSADPRIEGFFWKLNPTVNRADPAVQNDLHEFCHYFATHPEAVINDDIVDHINQQREIEKQHPLKDSDPLEAEAPAWIEKYTAFYWLQHPEADRDSPAIQAELSVFLHQCARDPGRTANDLFIDRALGVSDSVAPQSPSPLLTFPALADKVPGTSVPKGSVPEAIRAHQRIGNALMAMAGKDDPVITYGPVLAHIGALEPQMQALSNDQLAAKTVEFKARLAAGESMDALLPEAFAVVREAALRATGMRPFDVQMLGAIAMAHGNIAEMGTGEGKTLTGAMVTYLHALAGKGALVMTVNDTLSQRDAENIGRVYGALGLSVGLVTETMPTADKKIAYGADVTFLVDRTYGFDYLRDNMARRQEDVVTREPYFCLLDEVDDILIDEARTPLILSATTQPSTDQYQKFSALLDKLHGGVREGENQPPPPDDWDFEVDFKKRTANLTDAGWTRVEELLGEPAWTSCNYKAMLKSVDEQQAGQKTVNVQFASDGEAAPFIDMLQSQGREYVESKTGHSMKQGTAVIGIQYPEGLSRRPHDGPPQPTVTITSDSFKNEDRDYLQTALEAHTLYREGHEYSVIETPEFIDRRNITRLRLAFERLPEAAQKTIDQAAVQAMQQDLRDFVQPSAMGPGMDILRDWFSRLLPAERANPQGVDVPIQVLNLMANAHRRALMEEHVQALPADAAAALEKDVKATMGRDPNAKVQIVDQYTGRIMDGRRYGQGIHQAIEAKEGVKVQAETRTMASITYPNLFRLFPKLTGMSGTAKTEEEEFQKLYGLSVAVIPPNVKSQRIDLPDVIFKTKKEKYAWDIEQAVQAYNKGEPFVLATLSVDDNKLMSQMLTDRGIPHQVLNAESVQGNTAAENAILERAGESGMVTVVTDMAGRGVDIKPDLINFKMLTQTASDALAEAAEAVRARNLQAEFDKLPAADQATLQAAGEVDAQAAFRTQQIEALPGILPPAEFEAMETAAHERTEERLRRPGQEAGLMDPDLYADTVETELRVALGERLQQLTPEESQALQKAVGTEPDEATRRLARLGLVEKHLGWDPQVSFREADRGVGITIDTTNAKQRFKEADRMYRWLNEKGIPVTFAEPGTAAANLWPGYVTILFEGASTHPASLPAGASPAAVDAAPEYSPPGPSQPGAVLTASDFPTGGLHILGIERHDSRRPDNQLRGRPGRQGQPGTSQFSLSLEDYLLKYFGQDSLTKWFEKLGVADGTAVSDAHISELVSKAQRAVEAMHFEQRANTTKYDGAMNLQRKVIYGDRKAVLAGQDLKDSVLGWADDKIRDIAKDYPHHGHLSLDDAQALTDRFKEFFALPATALPLGDDQHVDRKALLERLSTAVEERYDAQQKELGDEAMKARTANQFLDALDVNWSQHLDNMTALQQGIGWQGLAQKDPLVAFQSAAYDEFQSFKQRVQEEALQAIFRPNVVQANRPTGGPLIPTVPAAFIPGPALIQRDGLMQAMATVEAA